MISNPDVSNSFLSVGTGWEAMSCCEDVLIRNQSSAANRLKIKVGSGLSQDHCPRPLGRGRFEASDDAKHLWFFRGLESFFDNSETFIEHKVLLLPRECHLLQQLEQVEDFSSSLKPVVRSLLGRDWSVGVSESFESSFLLDNTL